MLTDEATYTGYYTICWVEMQLTSISKSIIIEQSGDKEETKWKLQKACQNNVNDGLCQNEWLYILDTAMAK
jgi:hypothetical protein